MNNIFFKKFNKKIWVLDGAMGTSLQKMNLTAKDFGGEKYLGCNEHLVLTKPEAVFAVHESFLAVGADIIETNTFGATSIVLAEYELSHKVKEINEAAVMLAKQACAKYATKDKPRFIAGSMGPTSKALSLRPGICFDELAEAFKEQALALTKAGVDYLLIETCTDTLNIKAAWNGVCKAFNECGYRIPVAISIAMESAGTMFAGQGIEACYASLEHIEPLLYIGFNCGTGPKEMKERIQILNEISCFPISVAPNAGVPDEQGKYLESPESMAKAIEIFLKQKWVNVIGGCCGTEPAHIKALVELEKKYSPRKIKKEKTLRLSGIESLCIEKENRPYIVGERANVIGSKIFKKLIEDNQFERAAEIARKQVNAGAQIIDICVSNPDRNEKQDIEKLLDHVINFIKVPLMIDSQDKEVVEAALKKIQGKSILNSVNLENGEKSFQELVPLAKQYGAAIVVGCISDQMAISAKDKLKAAIKSYELLVKKYGIKEQNIIFDPLVFPCATGDKKYLGSGKETINGLKLIKKKFPLCKILLGISNVSFGLPQVGREALNSVFLYEAVQAGLDFAIVNPEKIIRYSTLTTQEKQLCKNLLLNKKDSLAKFISYYREKKVEEKKVENKFLSVSERIKENILQGTKESLKENLDEALKTWDALGVINNPLMQAMDAVGQLFNKNELIIAEVLQSAEVMKTAVDYLQPFMKKDESYVKATMLLATVKGDVHDIGKNLVEIIFKNNGYKVIDLGIKCSSETLINAYKEYKPDLICLSGLLVKSAHQMAETANDLKEAGIHVPILVGGAALSEQFTKTKIALQYQGKVIYCKDVMSGLKLANELFGQEKL